MLSEIAKIFMNGRSQAVRLPKEFRFDCDEVYVTKQGDKIIISPTKPMWDDFFSQTSAFGDDYLTEREQSTHQERDILLMYILDTNACRGNPKTTGENHRE